MDKLKIINLTPNTLRIFDSAGDLVETVEPSGVVAHASPYRARTGKAGHIELYESGCMGVRYFGIPDPGEVYVVPDVYLAALRAEGLDDAGVYVPGDPVSDESGNVIGCVGLSR